MQARIFMEKLLNEKKMKKQREEDELRQMEMLAREEERVSVENFEAFRKLIFRENWKRRGSD